MATQHGVAEPNDSEMDTADDMMSSSCPGGEASRHSRLARKAESARQARLRHKQFVQELQDQVSVLTGRLTQSELQPSAHQAVCELKGALTPEQLGTLTGWLLASQGDGHVLERYSQPRVVEPELSLPRSIPISINAMTANGRDDAQSPMESDEDTFQMGEMSRSWDDIEGARSILNLNSPNGFHPGAGALPSSFMLPIAAASAPERMLHFSSFTPNVASAQRS